MEKLFLELRKKAKGNENFSALDSLNGKTIALAGTIQYLNFIEPIKKYLESQGKKVILKKGAFHEGHVIGCNPSAFDIKAEALLLLADGKFHGINNALKLNKEIFIFNLEKLEKISKEDLEKQTQRIRARKVNFLSSKKVGIILSTKHGQNFKGVEKIASKIEKLNKEVYLFETDNLNLTELENFPDISLWINTACYGIGLDDNRIINIQEILEFI